MYPGGSGGGGATGASEVGSQTLPKATGAIAEEDHGDATGAATGGGQ